MSQIAFNNSALERFRPLYQEWNATCYITELKIKSIFGVAAHPTLNPKLDRCHPLEG